MMVICLLWSQLSFSKGCSLDAFTWAGGDQGNPVSFSSGPMEKDNVRIWSSTVLAQVSTLTTQPLRPELLKFGVNLRCPSFNEHLLGARYNTKHIAFTLHHNLFNSYEPISQIRETAKKVGFLIKHHSYRVQKLRVSRTSHHTPLIN